MLTRLLVDTDLYCKLSVPGLFQEAINLLGVEITECGRLAALPYMLKKGPLRKLYGTDECDRLLAIAHTMPIVDSSDTKWLQQLASLQSIDPGEAQIFSMAAETSLLVMTGDKRALRALTTIPEMIELLSGRIVVFEAILLALCGRLGPEIVRQRIQRLSKIDRVVQVCFSPGIPDPMDGLNSYYNDLAAELQPLVLWNPQEYVTP